MQTLEQFRAFVDQEAATLIEQLNEVHVSMWSRSRACQDMLRQIDECAVVLRHIEGFQASMSVARGYGGCAPHGDMGSRLPG